jgi:hypothetical protein
MRVQVRALTLTLPCTHTHKHGVQEKRGLIWTPGEEAKCSATTKTSYEQVRLILRAQTLCLLLCVFFSLVIVVCMCALVHVRI